MVDMKILLEKEDRVWSNQRENIKCDKVINNEPNTWFRCVYVYVCASACVCTCIYMRAHCVTVFPSRLIDKW